MATSQLSQDTRSATGPGRRPSRRSVLALIPAGGHRVRLLLDLTAVEPGLQPSSRARTARHRS